MLAPFKAGNHIAHWVQPSEFNSSFTRLRLIKIFVSSLERSGYSKGPIHLAVYPEKGFVSGFNIGDEPAERFNRERSAMPTLTEPRQLKQYIPELTPERLASAGAVAEAFAFRVPEFYAQRVLNGREDDPLLDLILPSTDEMLDTDELWDATPSPYRASDSSFWIQKYEFQGLLRLTTACSGLCRFCYLKKKNAHSYVMREYDVNKVFDDLEVRGQALREVILSGGDPLCAPVDTLRAIAARMERLRTKFGRHAPHITIHTREPVWNPIIMLGKKSLLEALRLLLPKTYMFNVVHPREVTEDFLAAAHELAEVGGADGRPALLVQHPLFKGVNDSAEILQDLYDRLFQCSPPILPYYMVHPFYNGTLPKHRLSVAESQGIYRELLRRPGCLTPRLVVPTPWGKCVVGPNETLTSDGQDTLLWTKDGRQVRVP